MRTQVILLTILLAFWMAGCSYYYVSKVRGSEVFMFSTIMVDDEEIGLYHLPENSGKINRSSGRTLAIETRTPDPVSNALQYLEKSGPMTVYFGFASAEAETGEEFQRYLENLIVYLNNNQGKKVILYGHADNRGSEGANFDYSLRRAEHIKTKLIEVGIDEFQIRVEAMGDEFPIASNDTPEGRKMNRRVEMSLII
ncbi:MAG: OmpA family protein [Bacteroidetes bacterium]|nr:OmpA family protein [Bacteroidota bacterium]